MNTLGRTIRGDHFLRGEHFKGNRFPEENILSRTLFKRKTLLRGHYLREDHSGVNTFIGGNTLGESEI